MSDKLCAFESHSFSNFLIVGAMLSCQRWNCTSLRSCFFAVHWNGKKKKKSVSQALHTRATRIFQHIYLIYANDLAALNEGTINHYNDAFSFFLREKGSVTMRTRINSRCLFRFTSPLIKVSHRRCRFKRILLPFALLKKKQQPKKKNLHLLLFHLLGCPWTQEMLIAHRSQSDHKFR